MSRYSFLMFCTSVLLESPGLLYMSFSCIVVLLVLLILNWLLSKTLWEAVGTIQEIVGGATHVLGACFNCPDTFSN